MQKITDTGCTVVFVLMLLMLVAIGVRTFQSGPTTRTTTTVSSNEVLLRAVTSDSKVQMFDRLDINPKIITFPDGFGCRKLSGPIPYNDGFGNIYFYKLDCNGHIGYVNVQWVKAR